MRADEQERVGERRDERGSALVLVLILTLLLGGIVISLSVAVDAQSKSSLEGDVSQRQFRSADDALAKALALAQLNYTTYSGYSSLTQIVPGSGTWADTSTWEDDGKASIENVGGTSDFYTFRLRAKGRVNGAGGAREPEMVVRLSKERTNLSVPGLGAIVGKGDIKVNGGIVIDGNDYNPDGTKRTDAARIDVSGVTVTGGIDHSGSADIGGNGSVPADSSTATDGNQHDTGSKVWDPEDDLVTSIESDGFDNDGANGVDDPGEAAALFATDGVDNDGDGLVDGADTADGDTGSVDGTAISGWDSDGRDNDGDGMIDEDGFPNLAAWLMGKPSTVKNNGDFIEYAKAHGTYFSWDGSGGGKKLRAWQDGDGTGYPSGQLYSTWVGSDDAKDGDDIVYIEGRSDSTDDIGAFTLPNNGDSTYNPEYKPTLVIIQSYKYGDKDRDGDYDDDHASHDHHTAGNSGTVVGPIKVKSTGPTDGTFLGVFVADTVNDTNGNGQIIGSVFAFNADDSTIFGNGNFKIRFSSIVVGGLRDPGDDSAPLAPPAVLMWREVK